jgi:hypothetical protein
VTRAPRYAKQKDKNEPEIVSDLKKIGCSVWLLGSPVDLLVGYRARNFLIECKSRETDYGKNDRGTQAQKRFFETWNGQVKKAWSSSEAIDLVTNAYKNKPGIHDCCVCNGPFSLAQEGGRVGSIGILSVAFCPTCFAGVMDFAEQEMRGYDPDYLKELCDGWQNQGTDEG